MTKPGFFILVFFIFFGNTTFSQSVKVVSFNDFEPLLHKQTDSLYFINFWATWCVPCIKELPAIEKVAADFSHLKFKVLLVSLDMQSELNNRLIPFIIKNGIQSEVLLLNDPDFNSWINKVDTNWSGAIPASIIYKNTERAFYEKSFTYEELKQIIQFKLK